MEDLNFSFEDLNLEDKSLEFVNEENNNEEGTPTGEEGVLDTNNEEGIEGEGSGESQEENNDNSSQEPPSSDENNSSQNSALLAIAKYLKDEGALLVEDELQGVETLEQFKDLITKSNDVARYIKLNESQRRYQDALEAGIPTNDFEKIESEIVKFKGVSEELLETNAQTRYEVIAIDFMNQGIEQDKALKLAKLALNDENNLQDAKDALQNIIAHKEAQFKKLVNDSKEKTELELNEIKDEIYKKETLLDMKVNDITKGKLFDLITTKVDSDKNGIPMNEMQKWQKDNPLESTIILNYLYMMTNGGKDLGLIKTNTNSTAAKELEKKLKEMSFDKDGSLIIPEQLMGSGANSNSTQNKNLTINI